MKTKIIILSIILMFTGVSTLNTGCDDPCDTAILADLAFFTVGIVQPEIAVGAALVLGNVIENIHSECERQKADESKKKTAAYYREDENSAWEKVSFKDNNGVVTYDVIVDTKALEDGEQDSREENYAFSIVGEYRFELEADAYTNVNEENEDNNGADSENGSVTKTGKKSNLTVKVFDATKSGKFARKSGEPVIINYLGSKRLN